MLRQKCPLIRNKGELSNETQISDPSDWALHSAKSTLISLLDRYERLIENAHSFALTYETDFSLTQFLQFQYGIFMHNILSISIILNNKFFTDTLDQHPPPNS